MAECRANGQMVRVRLAVRWLDRLRGLLFSDPEEQRGTWILLTPCNAVHTIGMRYAIDVAFIDRSGTVIMAYQGIGPGRLRIASKKAVAVLERPSGGAGERWPVEGECVTWSIERAITPRSED